MTAKTDSEHNNGRAKHLEHHSPLHWRDSYLVLAAVISDLIGTNNASDIAQFIGHGVSHHTVRDWRRGRSGVPAWVKEIVNQRLQERRESLAQWQAYLATLPTAPGRTGDIQRKRKAPRLSGASRS